MMCPMSVDHSRALNTNSPLSSRNRSTSSGCHGYMCSVSATPVSPTAFACSASRLGEMSLSIEPTMVCICVSTIVPIRTLSACFYHSADRCRRLPAPSMKPRTLPARGHASVRGIRSAPEEYHNAYVRRKRTAVARSSPSGSVIAPAMCQNAAAMRRRGRPPHPDVLTPREWEVLALVREGCTNDQIAERLGITLDGAKYHVSQILAKLGVSSREEAAAWRREQRPWWTRLATLPFAARLVGAAVALAAIAGLGLLAWGVVVTTDSDNSLQPLATSTPSFSRPARLVWESTGEYRTEHAGIGLTVLTYHVNWAHIQIQYAFDHSGALRTSPQTITLTDDLGQSYEVIGNSVLDTVLGVTAGVLTTEPYKGQGAAFTLTVTNMTRLADNESPPEPVPGTWSVTFIENQEPGKPVTYTQGGRIAPEIMTAGDLTLAVAGPPGGRFIKLIVGRAGQESAIYAVITDVFARPLTEAEFRRRAGDFPPPGEQPVITPTPR